MDCDLSVITPCYNCEKWFTQLHQSVLQQSVASLEWIAVDDNSSDGTRDAIKAAASQSHPNVTVKGVYLDENVGPAGAINRGLGIFRGKHVMFLDSDDWFEEDSVHRLLQAMDEHPEVGLAYGRKSMFHEATGDFRCDRHAGELLADNPFWALVKAQFIGSGQFIIRASVLRDVCGDRVQLEPQLRAQNLQLLLLLARKTPFMFVDVNVLNCRVRGGSLSRSPGNRGLRDVLKLHQERQEILTYCLARLGLDRSWPVRARAAWHMRLRCIGQVAGYYKSQLKARCKGLGIGPRPGGGQAKGQ